MYTVTLKGGSPWGFRFQGGCDFNEPIKIAKINPNSKAYKEGIKVGDYIEHINGQKTEGLLHNDVQQIIKCANKELTLDLRSCKSPMMNGQINGDIHPIEAQIISGIFRATPHYIQPQRKTTADDYKPISYHTISTTTNSSSSRPPSSVKVNPSPYRGSHSVPSSPRFQSKLIVPITSPKPLRHRDAAWDRSSPSPSLWSTTSCYTSDSARSTPQTSPACRRRQPPLPLPKPITTGGRSRRQIFEHSSSLGSSARSLVSPNRSLGSPSRSISPATSDHSSKGMQMFLRQMEKLSRYSDDEDKGVSDSSTLTAHSLPQEDRQLPIMKEEVAVEEHIIPISVKRERMIPLTIKTSTPDLRNFPQEETRSLDSGITSRGSSWQSGSFKDGNFSPGSYYTLPVRKSSSEKVTDKQNDDFDYSKCTTLPTIKPLKTHRGYESEMNYDGRGINDVRVQSQRKPIVVPQDGYNTDVDYSGRGRGDMRVRSQRKPIIVPQDGYNTDVDYSGRGRGDMHIHSQRKPIVLQDGYNTDLDYNGRGRGDMRVHSHRKPIGVPQDGYSTDVDFCVRNNHRNNQDYSQGRQFNQRDFIHDMDLDSIKLPQKAKLYDQRGFVSEVDLSSLDSQPDFNRFRQWPAQPQTQPQAQPQYNPPQPVDSNLPRRHSETVQSPKYVTPSRQEKPNYTKWTPKSSPSVVRRQGSLDSSSSSPNRGRYIPIKVMHEESPQQPDVDTRVGQKNEEERPNHEVPPAMNGTHISTEYSPTTNIESHHEPTSPRRTVVHTESKPVISNVAPVWNPKKGTLFQKKEYKPIKLDTLRKTSMEIQKQHVENQKPEELNIIPPPPEDSYACQQPEKDELHEYKSFVSYNPQTSISETAPAEPSRTEYAPYQPKTEFVDYTFSNGQFDDEPSRLPPTQSPFVTLLRKGREGQIPKGALYIGEQALVQDGLKHTDTYYAVPTTEEEDMSQQSPTSPSEKKPLKYDGIGPTDDGGMPLSFRMNVDEKNQHQWYKQMYKSLHTSKKKEESNSYRPTYEFPEVKTEPKPKEEENPYKPAYELPSTHREDSSKFRVSEKNKQNGRLSSSQTEKITKTDFNQRKELFTGKKDVDAGYRSEPENSSTTKSRSKSLSDFKADFKSSTKPKTLDTEISEEVQDFLNYLDEWNPPNARSTVEKYRCQPRSIVDYEPGFSSLAFQEAKTGAVHNPPIDKPGQFSRYTEGAHTRLAAGAGDNNSDEAANQADLYKLVQQGGDIPIRGLQKPGPDKSGTFKFQTSDVRRSPTERVQRRREDEEEYRRKRLEQIYEEERRRKIEQEKADLEARKHNDFFTQEIYMDAAQKSPIPADRFEEPISGYNTVPADRRRGFKIHGKAKAVYNFNAQNPRELSFRKGDIIYLLRQIDKNWFEGERYGRSGLFPVNYVEVLTSIEEAHTAAQQAEGQARVRYNFTAQTGVELTLRKGDIVTLLRSVDENWYEGRVGNKQGIFPRSYIEVIFDPSTPLVTPAPSVITTPMTGRGTPEMLSPSGYDAPTPPPQPSPRAFSPRSSAFQHHQQRQFSPQQQGMSPHQQTLSPQQQGMSPHQQSFSPQQQGLSPHQQTFSASQQGLNSHQPAFSPQRSSYTSPRYDGPQQQRMEDGPVRVNGYSQYNGDYNGSPQHQGQQQGRPRQSPTIGRKQFVSNGPSYPPSANINYNVETNNNEIRNKVPDDDLALCRYRAVFAYRPQNDDELELLEGDEVYVMEKCDDGWYVGTSNRTAMFGTFPGNYVQLIQ
ncbi:sorbin and SH3 domain-containing protein 1 homolog isoform X45 [Mytilus edulis]|uniref:sorbin and SH3 domain-containing protein 1 homolog isoform X45 n=1 Tax=Mytilus edulis TaxID=6550 RepID=UPI0039F0D41B